MQSYHSSSGIGEVTVSNPRTVVDPRISITPHVTYSVRDANYGPDVERRYSDFVWFSERMALFYPGIIIPPLPPKNSLGRFNDRFIEARRVALEKFINKVVKHKRLGKFSDLETFLRAPDAVFATSKRETAAPIHLAATVWLEKALKSNGANYVNKNILYPLFSTYYNNMLFVFKRPMLSPKTATDVTFDGISITVNRLHSRVQMITQAISQYVNNAYQQSQCMGEIGDVLKAIECLEEDPSLCSYSTEMSIQSKAGSGTFECLGDEGSSEMLYPLEEYLSLLESVQKAISRREEMRERCAFCKDQVALANKRLLMRGDMAAQQLRQGDLHMAMEALNEVNASLKHLSEEFLEEYKQFQDTRVREINFLLLNFANMQLKFSKAMESTATGFANKIISITPRVHEICFHQLPLMERGKLHCMVLPRTPIGTPKSTPKGSPKRVEQLDAEETYSFTNVHPAIMQEIDDDG